MWAAGDIADWWDEQHRQSKKELDHFVDDNPNLFGVVVATFFATAMDLGAGTVDALRFGQGMAEGGVKGVAKDAIRLLALAGPLGKGAKFVQTTANARLARLIVDRGGGICGWMSGTQALRQTGTKAFVAVEDLADALGKDVKLLGGSNLPERVNLFKEIGARISNVRAVRSMEDIANLTKRDGGVTMFNIFGKRMSAGVLKNVGHAVFAYRDSLGRLRILDRGGSAGKVGEVFESLEALALKYGVRGGWTVKEAAVMENVFAKFMSAISSGPIFAMATYALAGLHPKEHETVAQAFEVHKTLATQGKPALAGSGARYHVVAKGDWLSKIAGHYYGEMHKWPVIFEANRDIIGHDPNRIEVGQKLLIPVLPPVRKMRAQHAPHAVH